MINSRPIQRPMISAFVVFFFILLGHGGSAASASLASQTAPAKRGDYRTPRVPYERPRIKIANHGLVEQAWKQDLQAATICERR